MIFSDFRMIWCLGMYLYVHTTHVKKWSLPAVTVVDLVDFWKWGQTDGTCVDMVITTGLDLTYFYLLIPFLFLAWHSHLLFHFHQPSQSYSQSQPIIEKCLQSWIHLLPLVHSRHPLIDCLFRKLLLPIHLRLHCPHFGPDRRAPLQNHPCCLALKRGNLNLKLKSFSCWWFGYRFHSRRKSNYQPSTVGSSGFFSLSLTKVELRYQRKASCKRSSVFSRKIEKHIQSNSPYSEYSI